MASSSISIFKLACLVVLACMVVRPLTVNALTCGQVSSGVAPCFSYVLQGGPLTPGCCVSLKNLYSSAKTQPDRRAGCGCLKNIAAGLHGLNLGLVGSLPSKCGINIPYKISPSTDCSKVV